MSETRDGLSGTGSRLSGEENRELTPTPAEPNWPLLYSAVLAELVVLVVLFYMFTKAFA